MIKEEIKKKPVYIAEYENRFKSKLKSNLKKETSKLQQQEIDHNAKYPTFKPK